MGFLRKKFKQIKKGVKSVLQKVGKVFDKLGPIGTVGLMMAMPYAVQAIQGVFSGGTAAASSQAGVGLTEAAGEKLAQTATEKVTEKAAQKLTESATKSTLETAAGNMTKAALDNTTNQIVDTTVSGTMEKLAESAINYVKPGDMSTVATQPTAFENLLASAPAGQAERSFFQKTGDFFGEVRFGENYGWKIIGWGGTNYSGTKIGDGSAWKPGFTKPLWTWTPSIAVGNILIYDGKAFPEWKGDVLVTSLKFKTLYKLKFDGDEVQSQDVIFKNRIGRIRDIDMNSKGEIFLINSNSNASLWKFEKIKITWWGSNLH